jgi:hypothetical protein
VLKPGSSKDKSSLYSSLSLSLSLCLSVCWTRSLSVSLVVILALISCSYSYVKRFLPFPIHAAYSCLSSITSDCSFLYCTARSIDIEQNDEQHFSFALVFLLSRIDSVCLVSFVLTNRVIILCTSSCHEQLDVSADTFLICSFVQSRTSLIH